MIDLYFWKTPNGYKISICLEEIGLPYRLIPVDIGAGEQFRPEFLAIAPNNKIPAIVDHAPADGGAPVSLFESGAILSYLAEKTGKLLPKDLHGRWTTLQWVHWQVAGLGPMSGQLYHFLHRSEPIAPAIERYRNETLRLYGVLDRQLQGREYIAGEYSIADIASWPWMRHYGDLGIDLASFPNVAAWIERVGRREAVQRALAGKNTTSADQPPERAQG